MNSERKLLKAIASVEKEIQKKQRKAAYHQQYFHQMIHQHVILLTVLLVPTFLIGWKKGKKSSIGIRIKKLIGWALVSGLTYVRNMVWNSLVKDIQRRVELNYR